MARSSSPLLLTNEKPPPVGKGSAALSDSFDDQRGPVRSSVTRLRIRHRLADSVRAPRPLSVATGRGGT